MMSLLLPDVTPLSRLVFHGIDRGVNDTGMSSRNEHARAASDAQSKRDARADGSDRPGP